MQESGIIDKKDSIWSYNFIALFMTNAVMFFGQFMMSTLLPKYLSRLGFSGSIIGIIMGMFSVTALGTRPITGPLIDNMNKKKLYMCMLTILVITSFGYSVASSIPLLVFFRLLHGVSMGCSSALVLTMVTETIPKRKLASGLGIFGLSGILPMAFGPGIGLAVMENFSYSAAFSFAGFLIVISMVVSSRLRIKDHPDHKFSFQFGNIIAKEAVIPSLFIFMLSLARAGFNTFLVLYITEYRNIPGISVYFLINAGVLLVSRPLFGWIADKYSIPIALVSSYIFMAATFVLLAFCTQTWQLWLVGAFNGMGMGPTFSAHQTLVMKSVPVSKRGAGSSTSFAGMDLGDLIGPTIAGIIVQTSGFSAMFLVSLFPLAFCIIIFYSWIRKNRGIPEPLDED